MNKIHLKINDQVISVTSGCSVAVALLSDGIHSFRVSTSEKPRGPLCGMGVCFECRVTIDGKLHQRSCMIPCREGMEIHTS